MSKFDKYSISSQDSPSNFNGNMSNLDRLPSHLNYEPENFQLQSSPVTLDKSDKPVSRLQSRVSAERTWSGMGGDREQDTNDTYSSHLPDALIAESLERVSRLSSRNLDPESTPVDIDIEGAQDDFPPPDKGFAWVIAVICMLAVVATWGSNAAFGVFLQYYLDNDVFTGATKYDFALIGGIVVCLAQALCPFAAILYRTIGIKAIITVAIILQTLGYILASFATKLWQLYLCQGFVVGLSFSLIFVPATLILPTWFVKYKALAFGILVSGAGVGGVVFSLSINRVFHMTGSQHWGLRLTALMALISALPCYFLRPRTEKPVPIKQRLLKLFIMENAKVIFDLSVMLDVPILVHALWFLLASIGYVLMLFSLSSYATSIGLSASQATSLTAILNGGQAIGRPLFGLLGDLVGRSNAACVGCLLLSIWLWAYWINATTFGALIPFSLLLGLVVGIGYIMGQPICLDLLRQPNKLGQAWSGMNIMVGLASLVAEVIAVALTKDTGRRYLNVQIFVGCCFFACFLIMLYLRNVLVARKLERLICASKTELTKFNATKTTYLTTETLENKDIQQEMDMLNERIEEYQRLLHPTFMCWIVRTFYPVRV